MFQQLYSPVRVWIKGIPFLFKNWYYRIQHPFLWQLIPEQSLGLQILETFVQILLIKNISMDQTLLTFLIYIRQMWMTQLILAFSL